MQPLETEQGEQPHVPADEGQEEGRLQAETGEELQETGGQRNGLVEAREEDGVEEVQVAEVHDNIPALEDSDGEDSEEEDSESEGEVQETPTVGGGRKERKNWRRNIWTDSEDDELPAQVGVEDHGSDQAGGEEMATVGREGGEGADSGGGPVEVTQAQEASHRIVQDGDHERDSHSQEIERSIARWRGAGGKGGGGGGHGDETGGGAPAQSEPHPPPPPEEVRVIRREVRRPAGRRAADEDRAAWREAGWQGGRTGQGGRGQLDSEPNRLGRIQAEEGGREVRGGAEDRGGGGDPGGADLEAAIEEPATPQDLPSMETLHTTQVPTLKWVPKAARGEFAREAAVIWQRAANSGEERHLRLHLMFVRCIVPAGQGPRTGTNQAAALGQGRMVKERLRRWRAR